MELEILKILIGAGMFGSLFFIKKKYKQPLSLILISYLILIGANII